MDQLDDFVEHWKKAIHAVSQRPTPDHAEFGPNEWLVDELHQQYLEDKNSVDPAWWEFFADYQPSDTPLGPSRTEDGARANRAAASTNGGANGSANGSWPTAPAAPAPATSAPSAPAPAASAPSAPAPAASAPSAPAAPAPTAPSSAGRADDAGHGAGHGARPPAGARPRPAVRAHRPPPP